MANAFDEKVNKISTTNLGIYANQIIAYIQDLNKTIIKLGQLHKETDGDKNVEFEGNQVGSIIWDKQKEAEKLYNRIMIEMEKRCKKDLGFHFDYPLISKLTGEVDKAFEQHLGRQNAAQKVAEAQTQINKLGEDEKKPKLIIAP